MKSKTFNISLATASTIVIAKEYIEVFIKANHKRVKVKASFKEKSIDYHAALLRSKNGFYNMYFSKAKQKELGLEIGDTFTIQLYQDTSKYGVEPCEEFEAVMQTDYEAYSIFEKLTSGKKRSIIYAIGRYKSSQTRIDKTLLFAKNLNKGIFDAKLWLKEN